MVDACELKYNRIPAGIDVLDVLTHCDAGFHAGYSNTSRLRIRGDEDSGADLSRQMPRRFRNSKKDGNGEPAITEFNAANFPTV